MRACLENTKNCMVLLYTESHCTMRIPIYDAVSEIILAKQVGDFLVFVSKINVHILYAYHYVWWSVPVESTSIILLCDDVFIERLAPSAPGRATAAVHYIYV